MRALKPHASEPAALNMPQLMVGLLSRFHRLNHLQSCGTAVGWEFLGDLIGAQIVETHWVSLLHK